MIDKDTDDTTAQYWYDTGYQTATTHYQPLLEQVRLALLKADNVLGGCTEASPYYDARNSVKSAIFAINEATNNK